MVRSDRADLVVSRVRADATEEHAYLCLPPPQVRPQDVDLVGVGDLGCSERLDAAPEPQPPASGNPKVADPLRHTARRDEVATAVQGQEVDRCRAPLAAGPPPDLEDARSPDAQPETCRGRDDTVEHVAGEPPGLHIAVAGWGHRSS